MEQPLMLQCYCVDCPNYEGFGQCYYYGNITNETKEECVFKDDDYGTDRQSCNSCRDRETN